MSPLPGLHGHGQPFRLPPSAFLISPCHFLPRPYRQRVATYHLDLHSHSFFSADGVSDPVALIAAARKKGLHGFAMTDHNTCEAVGYLQEKGLLRADGLPVDGFLVIPGVEVTTQEGHLLCLGATLPDMKGRPAAEVVAAIHAAGGIAIPPHPLRHFPRRHPAGHARHAAD